MKFSTLRALLDGDIENAIVSATPGGIEAQEARGQKQFVRSETLPRKFNYGNRQQFEQMGLVFGEFADDLFINVTLPPGWKKQATSHSMWSHLTDELGRERASIFYKAAFYDRDAFININRRFTYKTQPVGGYDSDGYRKGRETHPFECVVTDCDTVIWTSEPVSPSAQLEWFRIDDVLRPMGKAWLDKNYPDWENPIAYW